MAEEKFDKVVLEVPGEPVKEMTPQEFRAFPLAQRVDLLVKGRFKFYKNGASLSPLEALKT